MAMESFFQSGFRVDQIQEHIYDSDYKLTLAMFEGSNTEFLRQYDTMDGTFFHIVVNAKNFSVICRAEIFIYYDLNIFLFIISNDYYITSPI